MNAQVILTQSNYLIRQAVTSPVLPSSRQLSSTFRNETRPHSPTTHQVEPEDVLDGDGRLLVAPGKRAALGM
jgi:hypothetical protein